ncbi:DUF2326 domain-containing protein [Snodgrassella alvi]|uniref:DUF2326 domain-containing protein n=1 Tax=Snodgrassella alvi TaxID=1196083 RepID=UPI000A03B97F|nr:DUF2326 domain-containing protein [Snodgrassella alvi]ORF02455.1 hypothetical protein BGH97_04760 [Snodgrassella alvi]ORF09936.1 hypothetical protein BGH99_00500 [Snodgrassella alvi]ORF15396.1 hypothetical protein BGI02_03160 [Snodgrassella alvi]ORF15929.1 hypothetical protein BGI00_00215 [Snodgrassella alvi]ORF28042.1 hypothetical protein BGI06_00215 [Snodgrassella alvi]
MFLRELLITTGQGVEIRKVVFKNGVNIILGKQNQNNNGSTNNLGKTTLLRCIDFCLGAESLEEIYADKEFKQNNEEVKSFLTEVKPIFILKISSSFDSKDFISIKREVDLNLKTDRIKNFINGEKISNSDFKNIKLKEIFFGSDEEKPTFRELIGKFIRKNETSINQIIEYAGPYFKDSQYEKVYFFLMGLDSPGLLTNKISIEKNLKDYKTKLRNLGRNNSEVSALKQDFFLISNDLDKLKRLRDEFKIDTEHKKEEEELNKTQLSLQKIESEIASLELKKKINLERQTELKNKQVSVDTVSLKYIYDEANYFNDSLPRTLDELVRFHNIMINNQIDYLTSSIEKYTSLIEEKEKTRLEYINEYNKLLSFFGTSGSLAEYNKLNEEISQKSIKYGEITSNIETLNLYTDKINEYKGELDKINELIYSLLPNLDKNLNIFNKYFSEYASKLSGNQDKLYTLFYTKKKDIYKFLIKNFDANSGSGFKQAMVIAFDLAYMSFTNELGLIRPHFATQDKVEVIDKTNLEALFSIANNINGQLIVPVIWDKFGNDSEIEENCILKLSSTNKFFNIEKFSNLLL